MDESSSLSHTKWACKYHVVFTPKFRRKEFMENTGGGGWNLNLFSTLEYNIIDNPNITLVLNQNKW